LPRGDIAFLADAQDGSALGCGQGEGFGFWLGFGFPVFLMEMQFDLVVEGFNRMRLVEPVITVLGVGVESDSLQLAESGHGLSGGGDAFTGKLGMADFDDVDFLAHRAWRAWDWCQSARALILAT